MVTIYVFLWIEILITLASSIWLSKLYIQNSAYSRDAVLIIAGLSTIALSCFAVLFNPESIMGQTLLTQVLMSLFLLGNVKSRKTKWVSNFAKGIILCLFAVTIAVNNVVSYQMSLMAIALVNFLFTFINFNKAQTRIFDIAENVLAIIVMSNCYNYSVAPNINSKIILLCSILVFNGVITFHTTKRTIGLTKLFSSMKTETKNIKKKKSKKSS